METTSPNQTTDWREGRRIRAWELHHKGWTQQRIAEALGVTQGAVSQWLKRAREGGIAGLLHRKSPGAPPKLTGAQKAQLPSLLERGAQAFGFRGDIWTQPRIAQLIRKEFGVSYDPSQVGRILKSCGWSIQKPIGRDARRDEQAIERWKNERWPKLKKKAQEEGYTIVWIDESGFYLLPMVVRTYAPVGKTPIIRQWVSRDHLSAIGAITADGKLYMLVQEEAIRSWDVVSFLIHLLVHIPGKLMVIWDGAPIHRSKAIRSFLSAGAAKRLHLECLPAYAPDLDPAEGIWNYLKRVELKNVSCQDVPQLRGELRQARERLRHKPRVLKACISQPGFY
jgi:transposase